jgi:hypothetical protein
MPALTSENVALAIPKFIAAQFMPALIGKLIIGQLVNRNFDSVLGSSGDTVNVPIAPTLVANNLAEGGTVVTQNPNIGSAQIVLDTHLESSFQLPDVTRALAQPDLMALYMDPAVKAIATRIETDLINVYPLFTANAAVGSATAMDEARLDTAETELFSSFAPQDEPQFMLTSAGAFSQLRQIPRFTEYQTVGPAVGDSPMVTGMLPGRTDGPNGANGKIKNFLVYRSQYVPNVAGTTFNLAFSRDAFALVTRRLPLVMPGLGAVQAYAELGGYSLRITMSYVSGQLGTLVTVDTLYGVGVLRNQFGVIVKSNT